MTSHATDPRPVRRVSAVTASGAISQEDFDPVVVEAPLSIAIDGEVLATTMRTPGHDEDLAVGWLASETDLAARDQILKIERDGAAASRAQGIEEAVDTVSLSVASSVDVPKPRAYLTSSSCGICSAEVIEATPRPRAMLQTEGWQLTPQQAHQWVAAMREEQKMFELTGSLHAAAIVSPGGILQVVREDVGRHNAVDKVIGSAFLSEDYPLTDHTLVVSGRVSYEIVAKALRACLAGIVAVSGPTTLAVDLARAHGLVLVGFTRDDRLNVYAGGDHVAL
ncbi:MAG: formate dehydrogenase accessory sulfurtransferase FdhD [Luminiphilus sp.]|jgi:FdhD protein|nr:formate dehydrogenase accessory sulfurtransferase FdhD [Luminiphilus sp.]MDG2037547.1 formate dehydrogenase accessory sulfurtransferase FdhD [Luminiphilus sp.]RZO78962.1 MAG: formate dehydrogenase accessory sulfurtransferase FdhD [Halieaceae bacterium]